MSSTTFDHHQLTDIINSFINSSSSSSSSSRFLTSIITGQRGSGKTFFLDQLHKAVARISGDATSSLSFDKTLCQQTTTIHQPDKSSSFIHHFHCNGLPSEMQKMVLTIELFVERELMKKTKQDDELSNDNHPPTRHHHHTLFITIDDYDLLLLLNKLHNNNSNSSNSDDTSPTSSGASRFTNNNNDSNQNQESLTKLTWGWLYDHYFNNNYDSKKISSTNDWSNIDVILVATTSSTSNLLNDPSSTLWIFPDSLTFNLDDSNNKQKKALSSSKETTTSTTTVRKVKNCLSKIIPETMRKMTASEEKLIEKVFSSNDDDVLLPEMILQVALLLTQLKKSQNSDEFNQVMDLVLKNETERRNYFEPLLLTAIVEEEEDDDNSTQGRNQNSGNKINNSKFSSLAKRSGCYSAFSKLSETIERFAIYYQNTSSNNNNNNTNNNGTNDDDDKISTRKRQGKVAAALQPPSGVLIIDGDRCDGRAHLVADLALKSAKKTIPGLSTHVVDAPLLFGPIFGETEERIRAAFSDAYAQRPCVLLIQNVDAIALSRGALMNSSSSSGSSSASSSTSGNVLQRAVATFLIESDGVDRPDRSSSVLIVATTSNKQDMDSAALRPGRLEMHIQLSDFLKKKNRNSDDNTDDHNQVATSEDANLACDDPKDLVDCWFDTFEEKKNSTKTSDTLMRKITVKLQQPGTTSTSSSEVMKQDLQKFFNEVLVEDAVRLIHELIMKVDPTDCSIREEVVRKYLGI